MRGTDCKSGAGRAVLAGLVALGVAGAGLGLCPTAGFVGGAGAPLVATAQAAGAYADGTYSAEVKGIGGKFEVTVTIEGGAIKSVEIGDNSETQGIGSRAIEVLPERIVEANGTEGVDGVSGASVTSKAIFDGVEDCLEQAAIEGGNAEETEAAAGNAEKAEPTESASASKPDIPLLSSDGMRDEEGNVVVEGIRFTVPEGLEWAETFDGGDEWTDGSASFSFSIAENYATENGANPDDVQSTIKKHEDDQIEIVADMLSGDSEATVESETLTNGADIWLYKGHYFFDVEILDDTYTWHSVTVIIPTPTGQLIKVSYSVTSDSADTSELDDVIDAFIESVRYEGADAADDAEAEEATEADDGSHTGVVQFGSMSITIPKSYECTTYKASESQISAMWQTDNGALILLYFPDGIGEYSADSTDNASLLLYAIGKAFNEDMSYNFDAERYTLDDGTRIYMGSYNYGSGSIPGYVTSSTSGETLYLLILKVAGLSDIIEIPLTITGGIGSK